METYVLIIKIVFLLRLWIRTWHYNDWCNFEWFKKEKLSHFGEDHKFKKLCLVTNLSDYLANVLNMGTILAISGKASQRQNYDNDEVVNFFWNDFHHVFRCGSVSWALSPKPKGRRFDSQSGHMSGLWARSPVGGEQEEATQCFSLTSMFLLPFLPPFPSL